jgi:hypothetical protein
VLQHDAFHDGVCPERRRGDGPASRGYEGRCAGRSSPGSTAILTDSSHSELVHYLYRAFGNPTILFDTQPPFCPTFADAPHLGGRGC